MFGVVSRLLVVVLSIISGQILLAADDALQYELQIEQRKLMGQPQKLKAREGQWLNVRWLSDESLDIHLHGYDIELAVVANKPTMMKFKADATGRFAITSHGNGEVDEFKSRRQRRPLIYLEVYPN